MYIWLLSSNCSFSMTAKAFVFVESADFQNMSWCPWKARCWPSWRLSRYLCTCLGQNKMVLSLKHESLCWRKQLHAAMPIKRNDMRENTSGGVMSMFHASFIYQHFDFFPRHIFCQLRTFRARPCRSSAWREATAILAGGYHAHSSPPTSAWKIARKNPVLRKKKKLNQQDLYHSEIGAKET